MPPVSEDEAKKRLILLTAVRVGGLLFMLVGLLLVARESSTPMQKYAGVALTIVGVVDLWLFPRLMLRLWRKGD